MPRNRKSLEEFKFEVFAQAKEIPQDAIILLSGEMGAGKTQWVKFFIEARGGGAVVSSPTFALHQEYQVPQGAIDHWDLYRIKDEDDLETTGFWENLFQNSGVCIVEWPEMAKIDGLEFQRPVFRFQIGTND